MPHHRRRRWLLVLGADAVIIVAVTTGFGGGGPGFGTGGMVSTDFGGDDVANALAIQRDGKIVAAGGRRTDFALARYARDGQLDTTFGTGGKVVNHLGARPFGWAPDYHLPGGAAAVAIQRDGKIIVTGGAGRDFVLARYTRQGQLDRRFGSHGKVLTNVGFREARGGRIEVAGAKAIALQVDGKIVVAGAGPGHSALARYTSHGRLDGSFGRGGVVVTRIARGGDSAEALAVQPNGRIVVAGWSDHWFAVARYLRNGRLDPAFGAGGKVVTNAGDDYDIASGVAVQRDGKIVAAGATGPRFPAPVLVRYTRAGTLDRRFGDGGWAPGCGRAGQATAVAIQPDGRILIAGDANYVDGSNGSISYKVVLLRYTRRGRRDRTFGNRGAVVTPIDLKHGVSTLNLEITALRLQKDGKIVIAGGSGSGAWKRDFLLMRYKPNGPLDTG